MAHPIGSVPTAVAAAKTQARTPAAIVAAIATKRAAIVTDAPNERSQPSLPMNASPTAVAAAGAASGTASETAGDAVVMKWASPSESGALKNGTEKQRKTNKKMMEQRHDSLVAAIAAHDRECLMRGILVDTRNGQVCIPSPMVMGDRSCGRTIDQQQPMVIQEAKRIVHKRVQWLSKQIVHETKAIAKLRARTEQIFKRDKSADQRRQKLLEKQDRRQRESLSNSEPAIAAAMRGRYISEIEDERLYGKRRRIIQNKPSVQAPAPCTPPFRHNAVDMAVLLDGMDDLFGEEGTQAASSASGEDELRKAVEEQFQQAQFGSR